MTVKFNKLEVGQQVELLPLGSKDLNGYVPHVIEKISEEHGEVVFGDDTIPPFFVRPAAVYQGHYLTAIKDFFTAYDIIVPESTHATDRVPFRDIVIHGLWRNPIRGLSIPFPISIHPELGTGGTESFQCFATVVFPGINDVGTTLRCSEKCPNPECGSVFQRDAHAFFQAVATTLANHITTQVRTGKTYDEALDDWLEQVSQVFDGITADFIRSPSKGEGSGIAVVGSIADLEALVGQVSGGSRGRRRIR